VQGWNTTGVRSRRGWEYLQEEIIEPQSQTEYETGWWVVPLDVHY
jgi:hypothetical protein